LHVGDVLLQQLLNCSAIGIGLGLAQVAPNVSDQIPDQFGLWMIVRGPLMLVGPGREI